VTASFSIWQTHQYNNAVSKYYNVISNNNLVKRHAIQLETQLDQLVTSKNNNGKNIGLDKIAQTKNSGTNLLYVSMPEHKPQTNEINQQITVIENHIKSIENYSQNLQSLIRQINQI
jgi:hypothetical protein